MFKVFVRLTGDPIHTVIITLLNHEWRPPSDAISTFDGAETVSSGDHLFLAWLRASQLIWAMKNALKLNAAYEPPSVQALQTLSDYVDLFTSLNVNKCFTESKWLDITVRQSENIGDFNFRTMPPLTPADMGNRLSDPLAVLFRVIPSDDAVEALNALAPANQAIPDALTLFEFGDSLRKGAKSNIDRLRAIRAANI